MTSITQTPDVWTKDLRSLRYKHKLNITLHPNKQPSGPHAKKLQHKPLGEIMNVNKTGTEISSHSWTHLALPAEIRTNPGPHSETPNNHIDEGKHLQ